MTQRGVTASIAIVLFAATVHGGQGQTTRDPRTARTGDGMLSGVVVTDDADGKPVRHARVTCAAPELTAGLTAISDDRGRFTCARLPAGRYTVSVTRDGWVPVTYGARRPLRPGTPVALAAGEHAEVIIKMMHGAVITGTLLDESGLPSINTGVVSLRSTMQNGERQMVASGVPGMTDDRGVYRIYGLAPGDYLVGASPHSRAPSELLATTDLDVHHARTASSGAPPPPDRGVAFAATYFPGTPMLSQASAISIGPGEERTGVDFALQLVATARVEGMVSTPDGTPVPPTAQITLLASGQSAFAGVALDGLKVSRVPPEGTFSFSGIAPGVYTLLARATLPGGDGAAPVLWASREIAVDGDRVSGVSLTLQPGLTLAGQVQFEPSTQRPAAMPSIQIVLQRVQAQTAISIATPAVAPDADGRFRIPGVTPGRYRLVASVRGVARPGGWVVRSAVVNGQDSLDVPILVIPNQIGLDAVIKFTDRLAQVSGTVPGSGGVTAADSTVVLFPTDPALWVAQTRRIQAVRPAADGTYLIRNLPAGTYFVTAVDDVEPGEWFDPAFLQRIGPAATRITLAEGESLALPNVRR